MCRALTAHRRDARRKCLRAQGQACPSGQAGRLSLAAVNLQAGAPELCLRIPLRWEKSALAATGQVCTPGALLKIPGDRGSLQGDVFACFLQDQILAAGSASSSTDTWVCRELSPNPACSSACPAGSCAALGKPQHCLFPFPIAGRRYSLLFDNKPQEESGKGPTQVIPSPVTQMLSPCSQRKVLPLGASGEESG